MVVCEALIWMNPRTGRYVLTILVRTEARCGYRYHEPLPYV